MDLFSPFYDSCFLVQRMYNLGTTKIFSLSVKLSSIKCELSLINLQKERLFPTD